MGEPPTRLRFEAAGFIIRSVTAFRRRLPGTSETPSFHWHARARMRAAMCTVAPPPFGDPQSPSPLTLWSCRVTIVSRVIASFGDDETAMLAAGREVLRFAHIAAAARRRLDLLEAATSLADLAVPAGNRLHRLKGRWANFYSIRVNAQYRIVFRWEGSACHDVTIIDYH